MEISPRDSKGRGRKKTRNHGNQGQNSVMELALVELL
jgi:hypothetical protein